MPERETARWILFLAVALGTYLAIFMIETHITPLPYRQGEVTMFKQKWGYQLLTKQAERSIAEHMELAKQGTDDSRVQYVEWAFGAYLLWFDIVAGSDEFQISDSMRLRGLCQALDREMEEKP